MVVGRSASVLPIHFSPSERVFANYSILIHPSQIVSNYLRWIRLDGIQLCVEHFCDPGHDLLGDNCVLFVNEFAVSDIVAIMVVNHRTRGWTVLLMTANMISSFLMVSECHFGRIIIKLFEVGPPIIMVMLHVGPGTSEAV
jgi:hypothetical protein